VEHKPPCLAGHLGWSSVGMTTCLRSGLDTAVPLKGDWGQLDSGQPFQTPQCLSLIQSLCLPWAEKVRRCWVGG